MIDESTKIIKNVHYSSNSDEWETPQFIFDRYNTNSAPFPSAIIIFNGVTRL